MTVPSDSFIPLPLCRQEKKAEKFGIAFLIALSVLPVLGILAPRSLAFGPGVVGLLFYFLLFVYLKKQPPFNRTAAAITGTILVLSFASILWALDPGEALTRSLKLAGIMIPGVCLISVAAHMPRPVLRRYLWLFSIGVGVAALIMIAEYILDYPLFRFLRGMDAGEYVAHAELNRGSVVILPLIFPVAGLVAVKTGRNILAVFTVLSCLYLPLLLMTESQSVQLAFLLGVLTLFFFPYKMWAAWYCLALLIAAGLLLAPFSAMWLFDNYAARIQTLPLLGAGAGGNAAHRLEIWDFVSRHALQNPLYGYGIEATRAVDAFDTAQIYHQGNTVLHPHNMAIQIWIEFGLLGVLVFSGLFGLIILQIKNFRLPQQRAALPIFIAALSIATTGYGIWQSWWVGLVILVSAVTILAIRSISEDLTDLA